MGFPELTSTKLATLAAIKGNAKHPVSDIPKKPSGHAQIARAKPSNVRVFVIAGSRNPKRLFFLACAASLVKIYDCYQKKHSCSQTQRLKKMKTIVYSNSCLGLDSHFIPSQSRSHPRIFPSTDYTRLLNFEPHVASLEEIPANR